MILDGGWVRALILLVSLIAGSTAGLCCGFENPNSVAVARGSLNWAFPDSLHVTSAVWQAKAAGVLEHETTPTAAMALVGYRKVAERLNAFRNGLAAARNSQDVPAVSMVLLGPVLWTRFAPTATSVDIATHVTGPELGDTIIVTDVPVIAALAAGRLTPQAARNLGLIRLYGASEAIERLSNWLNRWPLEMSEGGPIEQSEMSKGASD
jgi:hypothetical protein